jgi:hypothetical protein
MLTLPTLILAVLAICGLIWRITHMAEEIRRLRNRFFYCDKSRKYCRDKYFEISKIQDAIAKI